MDAFLNTITHHAMNYALRSGVAYTATYALRQTGRLMSAVEGNERRQLQSLEEKLQSKIRIISPAIDTIELISARGNTTLESAIELTSRLRASIQSVAQSLDQAATNEDLWRQGKLRTRSRADLKRDFKDVLSGLQQLLSQIEDAVPFLSLALTTSGAKLSTDLPKSVSPSRLLQASTLLTEADAEYTSRQQAESVQIGPTFVLSLYMLFSSHVRLNHEGDARQSTWKEAIHKARMKLVRVPVDEQDGFAYQILIIEDLDDGRVHDFETEGDQPESYEGVLQPGIREAIPVHQIAKIFYADTGKILNIGSENDAPRPVLLLKRDKGAIAPRTINTKLRSEIRASHEEDHEHVGRLGGLPADLDHEWLAFEMYSGGSEDYEDDSDDEDESSKPAVAAKPFRKASLDGEIISNLSRMSISSTSLTEHNRAARGVRDLTFRTGPSLSLLEVLLRLTSLQQFQQSTHLSIEDEFLSFFLSESATTGAAGGDEHERRALREEAKRRVGFDPYDESPIKQRGERHQYGGDKDADADDRSPSGEEKYIHDSIEESATSRRDSRERSTASSARHRHRLSGLDFPPLSLRNSTTPVRQVSLAQTPTPIGTPASQSPMSHQAGNDEVN